MTRALVVCAILLGACKEGETTDETIEAKGSSATGSAGGFSASLSAELAGATGSGSASGSAAGSASGSAAGSASGSAAGSASGSAAGSAAGSASGSAAGSAAGSASGSAAGSASGSAVGSAGTTPPQAGSASGSAAGSAATPTPPTPPVKQPVEVSAELKAIKLSLLPNWQRDAGEAGTISLFVEVQSRDERALFKFHYGYDVAGAPTDREAYKKFLAEKKLLTVAADRQRGAAWYMEGTDGAGHKAFRFLVNYGGKRLVCYGSLYKDSNLGDIRDEVVIQAKKICETLTL